MRSPPTRISAAIQKAIMHPSCKMPLMTAGIRNHTLPGECLVRILPISTVQCPVLDLSHGLISSRRRFAASGTFRPLPLTESVSCVGSTQSVRSLQLHTVHYKRKSHRRRKSLPRQLSGSGRGVVLRTARNESGERSGVSPMAPRFLYRQADACRSPIL